MKKLLIPFIIFALSLFSNLAAQGGPDTLRLQAMSRAFSTQVKIRWAPETFQMWRWGIEHGFTIERRTMQRNGQLLPIGEQQASVTILRKAIKPQPPSFWQDKIETNELAGIAAGVIYGEEFEIADLADKDFLKVYNTVQEQKAKFNFALFVADQSFAIAMDMGLGFIDYEAQPNETYLYRIYLDYSPPNHFLHPGITAATIGKTEPLPALYPLMAEFGDKEVQLLWNFEDFRTYYTSYQVERSDDVGLTFHPINKLPIVATKAPGMETKNIIFRDSLPENFKPYLYRVRGKSIFDDYGPYSNTAQGKGIPKALSIQMGITGITETKPGSLRLTWEFPDSLNPRLEGFECFRAPKKDGPFEKINHQLIPSDLRSFQDDHANGTNYYVIKALDIYGHKYNTFAVLGQLSDAEPPAPPTNLKATITKAGQVALEWAPNQEKDLLGYRVFFANTPEGNYAQLTSIYTRDTFYTFQVNMNVLNEKFYCKVIALDFRENYSAYSQPLEISRPDVIPPIAPLIKKIKPSSRGVLIQWIPSSSEDVERHLAQRKAPFESNWTTLPSGQLNEALYTLIDSTADRRFEYDYRVVAIDKAGLKSSSKIYKAKIIDSGIRSPIQSFQFEIDRKQKIITLSWAYQETNRLYEFVLYRSKNNEPLRTYKELLLSGPELSVEMLSNNARFSFQDQELNMDTQYTYQLLAKHRDGGYSPLSEPVQVQY